MSGENLTITHASFTALPFLFKYCCFSSVIDTLKQMNSEFFMLLQFPWQFLHLFAFPNMYIWRGLHSWRIYLKNLKIKQSLVLYHLLFSFGVIPFLPSSFTSFNFYIPVVSPVSVIVSSCKYLQPESHKIVHLLDNTSSPQNIAAKVSVDVFREWDPDEWLSGLRLFLQIVVYM